MILETPLAPREARPTMICGSLAASKKKRAETEEHRNSLVMCSALASMYRTRSHRRWPCVSIPVVWER